RVLEPCLDRLRAGVAEERLRASETTVEPRCEREHRLRPVEVRRVPELLELRLRRLERSRVTVAEPDDGDAGQQVQVPAPVLVADPRTPAADDRDVLARVRRQDRRHDVDVHATTAVRPISASTPTRPTLTAARSVGRM